MLGSCISVLILVLTLVFTAQQATIVFSRSGTLFTTSLALEHLSNDEFLTADDGLMIAFAVID